MNAAEIQCWLVTRIAEVMDLDPAEIDVREPFDSYGLASRDAVSLTGDLEDLLGRQLPPTLAYEYPNIAYLSTYLSDPDAEVAPAWSPPDESTRSDQRIAIVGMGCRFPGADDPASYWQLLRDGVDLIREVPPMRWDAATFYHPDAAVPGKAVSRWGGFLEQVDRFDPFFFGISPGEAERMDPQQRLLMELAFESFEDAGYPMSRLAGSGTAVFVGISVNEYAFFQAGQHDLITGHSGTGNALSVAANRISYFFDLHGPSMAVDTACSSSLAAIHLACQSIRTGECDLAIAGGVNVILSPDNAIAFTKAGVLAPDGRCKVFDARADGYVRGEGGGLVVLKPLSRALADGDLIHGVIHGCAVHQDGRTNGLMAPSREAQEAVLSAAYRDAGVSPGSIQYVEAHGTGTLLGDAIEARALGAVLSRDRIGDPCAIGSVKSNIGHLEAAAGIAGLIKVVLSLEHRAIPPSLHYTEPNPHVPFGELGLRVQSVLEPWPNYQQDALAAVSSFGFGGTNVHVVVGAAPERSTDDGDHETRPVSDDVCLLPLSAHSPDALASVGRAFQACLPSLSCDTTLPDVCANASLRRSHLDHRLAIVAGSRAELTACLEDYLRGVNNPNVVCEGAASAGHGDSGVAFVFSGQGGQWLGMGRELLQREAVFRSAIEDCDAVLRAHADWSLLEQLNGEEQHSRLDEIDVLQPTLFALQVALAKLWRAWGIEPKAVVGHSLGEIAAAYVAGVLTLEDAACIICARSRLLKRLSGTGGMAVVDLSFHETECLLARSVDHLSIAASNSPRSTVVSGDGAALTRLLAALERDGVFGSLVNVDVPSHGPLTYPLRAELRRLLAEVQPGPGSLPFVSTVTGAVLEGSSLDADYWARNLSEPVNFTGAVRHLAETGHQTFLEVGPHPVLQSSVQQGLMDLGRDGTVIPSLVRDEKCRTSMYRSLGTLYSLGAPVDWRQVYSKPTRPVTLPSYPWERERYWIDGLPPAPATAPGAGHVAAHTNGTEARVNRLLGDKVELARTSGELVWQTDLDPKNLRWLDDHRVNGEVVLPLSAYVDMALSAAADAGLAFPLGLETLTLSQSLVFPKGNPRTIQVTLTHGTEDGVSLSVFSRAVGASGEDWTLHATASLGSECAGSKTPETSRQVTLEEIKRDCTHEVGPDDLYRSLARLGLEYGPSLRGVEEIWRGDGQALGRVVLPETVQHESGGHQFHPALLDAALQVLAATRLAPPGSDEETISYMPTGCDYIELYHRPGRTLWSHAVLRSDSAPAALRVEADLYFFDESGQRVGKLSGLQLTRIVRDRTGPAPSPPPKNIWLYDVHWQPATWPEVESGVALGGDVGDRWLILTDGGGIGESLARQLTAMGQTCELLPFEEGAVDTWIGRQLGAELTPLRGVVHLWSVEHDPSAPPSTLSLRDSQRLGCEAVLSLVKGFVANSSSLGMPRLWLVTRGVHPVLPGDPVAVAQSPVWGLAKTIGFELPAFKCTAVDLDASSEADTAGELLFRQLCVDDGEDQVAIRGSDRFAPRLRPVTGSDRTLSCPQAARQRFQDDATYLITGGLGGLGLSVARWMVERGAGHLALVGRTEPSPAVRERVAALRSDGAEVDVLTGDISREDHVTAIMARVRGKGFPLRGIIHAAGVLENAPILDLDTGRMRRVMAAKVDGTWNLHAATVDDALDFFILFSSAVSVLGSPGQGNYAAANTFMDVFAHYRHQKGLPATSINWGPWAEVGLVADGLTTPGRSESQGVKCLSPNQGMEVLDQVLKDGTTQITALPFELRSLLDLYPSAARVPFFEDVIGRDSHLARLYSRPTLRQAYVAPRNDIERALAELWKQTLRIDRVGIHDSFFELGGDSVLAAQIVTAAHKTFGVGIDLQEAFDGFTIENLARRVASSLESPSPADRPESAERSSDQLSFVQERQLFLELLDPLTAVNHLALCLRVRGKLDVGALERSANQIVDRHEVLRTCFTTDQGRPFPRVTPSLRVELEVLEVRDGDGQLDEAVRLAELEAGMPFDLARPPLFRFKIFRLSAEEHVLLVVIHHTIADGWSLGVFVRELFTFYQGGSLPPLSMQYVDYATEQRRSLNGPLLQQQLHFWKQQLEGELPILDLPLDYRRPARQTFSGATHRFRVPVGMTQALKALGREHDATLFMTLVAAFNTVLYLYSGQDDILLGTPIAGRMHPETADLIGAFINTLVLRTDLSGDPTFGVLLERVREMALAAYAHQDLPFEKLVAELNPQRDLSRTPVFQVLFIQQNSPLPSYEVPGLRMQQLPIERGATQFDLTLMVTGTDGGLDAVFEYNTDLFDSASIERLADSFTRLLADAAAHPDRRLSQLAVMDQAHHDHLVRELNQTDADYPREKCVHQLFEAQVERSPDGVAVVCDDRELTYRELDSWANALAHDLRRRGVGPDVRVGVFLERSPALVASLIAVMKAGGAYLPIDPECPPNRLEFMLTDAEVRVLMTAEPLIPPPGGATDVINVERPNDANLSDWHNRGGAPPPNVTSENLAYVIYTSGSTGRPKGVLVPHRALVNLLWSMKGVAQVDHGDKLLAVTSIAFDIAALEVFLPLLTGATVVLATRGMTTDSQRLCDAIVRHDVRTMQATPATWRMMLQGGWQGHRGLIALCGGEPLTSVLAEELVQRVDQLWNVYGPTETTVWSTAGRVKRGQQSITIGRPIANTQLYILNTGGQPVPIGAVGELYIGGDGVSQGYLNRPELTEAKFVRHRFIDHADTTDRLFKTGDRARYQPDGSIRLLGRLDDQVKVNGVRIELGEIESVLIQHPSVQDAVVVVREGAGDEKILVAHYVPTDGTTEDTVELRTFLRTMLPACMVPSVFIPLTALPLTTAGKIDRKALQLQAPNPVASVPTTAPRTPLEEVLARIYAQVLGLESVGVEDNFFELGGGSIQILEIIVRAQHRGVVLTPEVFFEYQSVASLASFLEQSPQERAVAQVGP